MPVYLWFKAHWPYFWNRLVRCQYHHAFISKVSGHHRFNIHSPFYKWVMYTELCEGMTWRTHILSCVKGWQNWQETYIRNYVRGHQRHVCWIGWLYDTNDKRQVQQNSVNLACKRLNRCQTVGCYGLSDGAYIDLRF